ncbi:hypothetical protein VaNZ11_001082, partial [Volvox africanus]
RDLAPLLRLCSFESRLNPGSEPALQRLHGSAAAAPSCVPLPAPSDSRTQGYPGASPTEPAAPTRRPPEVLTMRADAGAAGDRLLAHAYPPGSAPRFELSLPTPSGLPPLRFVHRRMRCSVALVPVSDDGDGG